MCLTKDGNVYVWGGQAKGKRGDSESKRPRRKTKRPKEQDTVLYHVPWKIQAFEKIKVEAISCGQFHSLALDSAGRVYSWGENKDHQCGQPASKIEATDVIVKPRLIEALTRDSIKCIAIKAGGKHSFAVSEEGLLFSWGFNKYGQCGLKTSGETQPEPLEVIDF